jgi:hypothetical protein
VTPLVICGVHRFPGAQSVSLFLQIETHAPLAQTKGEQSRTPGSRQVPLPSQVRGVFSTKPEQVDGLHTSFSRKSVHEPKPSQFPLLPQVVWSLAMHARSGKRAGMNAQLPHDPVWLHDSQALSHLMLQHTPYSD